MGQANTKFLFIDRSLIFSIELLTISYYPTNQCILLKKFTFTHQSDKKCDEFVWRIPDPRCICMGRTNTECTKCTSARHPREKECGPEPLAAFVGGGGFARWAAAVVCFTPRHTYRPQRALVLYKLSTRAIGENARAPVI